MEDWNHINTKITVIYLIPLIFLEDCVLCIIRLPHFPGVEPFTFYNVGTAFAHIVYVVAL